MRLVISAAILSLLATTALAGPTVTEIKAPDLPLPEVTYPGGKTLKLNLGIGSAAWRDHKDPAGVIWTITDRGPNLDCIGIDKITDISIDKLCAGDETAKNSPCRNSPSPSPRSKSALTTRQSFSKPFR